MSKPATNDNGSRKLSSQAAKLFYSALLLISIMSFISAFILLLISKYQYVGSPVIILFVSLALYVRSNRYLSVTSFTLWMIASVTAAMFYPAPFSSWYGFKLKVLIIPLIQFIMFGMGTTLSIKDFKRVLTMPQAVLIGIFLQFTVMPFVGKGVAMLFTSNSEVAAGIVLTGSSPGGVASNVITYLAGGNVALSVTMTACSTLLAPFMTPAMTKWLAGAYIEVDFWKMMYSIIKMVIIPVSLGLLFNRFLNAMRKIHHNLEKISLFIMKSLPGFAMFAIAFACAIMTANARAQLLIGRIVFSIIISVIVHNFIGLMLGFWGAKLFRLGERECRTISIEVGLQNSGMAAGLAISVLKSELAAVPGVVYSSWHNMTGALLASWWSRKPVKDNE